MTDKILICYGTRYGSTSEVVNAMALGGQIGFIGQGMHIHPALPELILRTFSNLSEF